MRLAGELTQHLTCMIGRIGLAEDLAIEHDHRVGTNHKAQPHRILREHLLNGCTCFSLGKFLHGLFRLREQIGIERFVDWLSGVNTRNWTPAS